MAEAALGALSPDQRDSLSAPLEVKAIASQGDRRTHGWNLAQPYPVGNVGSVSKCHELENGFAEVDVRGEPRTLESEPRYERVH